MRTITRPPLELAIEDDTSLDTERPELDKSCEPKEGDLFQLIYRVEGGKAVLVSMIPIILG